MAFSRPSNRYASTHATHGWMRLTSVRWGWEHCFYVLVGSTGQQQRFMGHQIIFTERSEFFHAIFASVSPDLDRKTTIDLPDVHPEVFNGYLTVVFTRRVQTPDIPEDYHLGRVHALTQLYQLAQDLGDRVVADMVSDEVCRIAGARVTNQSLSMLPHAGPLVSANTAGMLPSTTQRDESP